MNKFYDGSEAARLPVFGEPCIVIGIIAIVMLQCRGCCDVFIYSSALNSIYYEQLDILPVLGVHNVSQVVTCWSKRGLRPQVQVHRYTDQRRHHSDMITLPTISI